MENSLNENDEAGCSTDTPESRRERQSGAARLRQRRKRARESSASRERRRKADMDAKRKSREEETPAVKVLRRQADAEGKRKSREEEDPVQRFLRQQADIEAKKRRRVEESSQQKLSRKQANAVRTKRKREAETAQQRARRRGLDASAHREKYDEAKRPARNADDPVTDEFRLSNFDVRCIHCGALHFDEERVQGKHDRNSFFDCCAHGKIEYKDGDIWIDDTDGTPRSLFKQYPDSFKDLFVGKYPEQGNFFLNIRKVNGSYALASLCANRYEFKTHGPYCFKLSGQVYYKFNTAAEPDEGDVPTNGQLFFVDTEEALEHRKAHLTVKDFRKGSYRTESCFRIFDMVEKYLRQNNDYAKAYTMMKEEQEEQTKNAEENGESCPEVRLLFKAPKKDDGTRNLPRSNEVAAVFITNANGDIPPASIVVHERGKQLKNLSPIDRNVEPMLYPLFYPNGGEGWYAEMRKKDASKLSMDQYVKCKLAVRESGTFVPLHYGRKLFQQWVVDQYARIEWERLGW